MMSHAVGEARMEPGNLYVDHPFRTVVFNVHGVRIQPPHATCTASHRVSSLCGWTFYLKQERFLGHVTRKSRTNDCKRR